MKVFFLSFITVEKVVWMDFTNDDALNPDSLSHSLGSTVLILNQISWVKGHSIQSTASV